MTAERHVRVARASDVEPGRISVVDVEGRSIGLINHEGAFYAVQNVCPHALAPLCLGALGGTWLPSEQGTWTYGLDGLVLRCPRHGWEYDIRTGMPVNNADRRKARTFPVEVVDGDVVVTLDGRSAGNAEPEPNQASA